MSQLEESQCVINEFEFETSSFKQICRTELAIDPQAPRWTNKLKVDFYPMSIQLLQFSVHNIFDEEMFSTSCPLASLFDLNPKVLEFQNMDKKLFISIAEDKKHPETVHIQLEAKHVDKKDFFGKSDPYFFLYKRTQEGWLEVYRSEIIKNSLNPAWKEFSLSSDNLGGIMNNSALRIEVWDWDRNKKDDFIGGAEISLSDLLTTGFEVPLIEPKKKNKKKNYENSGVLRVVHAKIDAHKSFVDFLLTGGWLGFGFGIDFTIRNGHSNMRTSFHYVESNKKTKYEEIILEIQEFLKDYNKSSFKVYGFGASSVWLNPVRHYFSLKQGTKDFNFSSTSEALTTYRESIPFIVFAEENNLCPLIEDFKNSLLHEANGGYFVLIIILCSQVSAVPALQEQILKTESSPLSLIFIEISSYMINDSSMFDCSSFSQSRRQNVLFIRLKDFQSCSKACSYALDRLPRQIEEYLKLT